MRSTSARVRPGLAAVVVAATLLGGCSSANPGGDFRAGAADLGDPYVPGAGNGGYDVEHYRLAVDYDPASDRLRGQATVTAVATQPLSRFNLDLQGLEVTAVGVDGDRAQHRRDGDELVVTPARGLTQGSRFTVTVEYAGSPGTRPNGPLGGGGFLHTEDGAIALGQPYSAAAWFPVNDHPSDKATYDIEVTVPDGLAALSNGVPGEQRSAGGRTTWRWAQRAPMASYLTTLVIGAYRVETGTHAGKPIVTAVPEQLPETSPEAVSLARTGEIADFLADRFGPYPFDSYGGVVVTDPRVGYALETQSRPVYGPAFFRSGQPNFGVVVHELAHQWFGDSVAVTQWRDIWLNEGFATYAEWLWEEHQGGRSVQRTFEDRYAATDWSLPALDPGPEQMFGTGVYQRGALTVHALRRTVGDDAFFAILQAWTAEWRDRNGTTDDFIELAERVAGEQLDGLFDAWLSGATRPAVPEPG
ncbi:M1 family metallopeptidase [Salinispora cortesiana]|uniref:M1 family metallopeptidase n=1 Tax=Salinispora cortesiana TaxID=1305843 RepID=UPI0003FB4469|nr:M1 family metallopeptidase [Salinispora cortesiana]